MDVLHDCNAMSFSMPNATVDGLTRTIQWNNDPAGHHHENLIIDDGYLLPNGYTAQSLEGGKCLMVRPVLRIDGTRWPGGVYSMLLNGAGDLDLHTRGLVKLRIYTNQPEVPINFYLAINPWITANILTVPGGTLVRNAWTEVGLDLRMCGLDLTIAKAINILCSQDEAPNDPETYFVLFDLVTAEPVGGIVPMGANLIPNGAILTPNELIVFSSRVWGGLPPYTVYWYVNDVLVETDTVELDSGVAAFSFSGDVGTYLLSAHIVDSQAEPYTAEVEVGPVTISVFPDLPPPEPCLPLHRQGNRILNSQGKTVHLHGDNVHGFEDGPNGHWIDQLGGVHWSNSGWVPDIMVEFLEGLRGWGINFARTHVALECWLSDVDGFREKYKIFLTECHNRGIYVLMEFYAIRYYGQPGQQATPIPYPPHINAEEAIYLESVVGHTWTEDDFVETWRQVAIELKGFPNLLFEPWNEPNGSEADAATWMGVVQRVITAIRSTGAQNLIAPQWGYGTGIMYYTDGTLAGTPTGLQWVTNYPLSDPTGNLCYQTHIYREYGGLGWWSPDQLWVNRLNFYRLADIERALADCGVFNVAATHPLIIGELGANLDTAQGSAILTPTGCEEDTSLSAVQGELIAYDNLLAIFDKHGIHYAPYWFWIQLGWRQLIPYAANYQPNESGKILVNHLMTYPPTPPSLPPIRYFMPFIVGGIVIWWKEV